MNNLEDLNIQKELLPLFDYSLNGFTKDKIIQILKTPLSSTSKVINQQNILKGFIANQSVLKDYSYSPLYLNEVYFFINDEKIEDLSQKKIRYQLFTSRQTKFKNFSKFSQLILFFYRLQSRYFSKLKLSVFPKEYGLNIKHIFQFFTNLQLEKYNQLVKEDKLRDKHIIELTQKIDALKKNKLLSPFWEDLFLFEAYLSISKGIINNGFVFPKLSNEHIKLTDFYHPLIKNPVKNNFETTSGVILLSGSNMSGKSTFLKSVGLCVYLGHLGIGIPATDGEIPFCNYFSIDINKKDDILNGYSHFMTEILSLKKVVQNASNRKRCFAIFDELFSGTNFKDSLEICKTTINGLSKYKNSYFFISTHIEELNTLTNSQISNYYIDCQLVNDKPTFTYKLKKGWSDVKIGRVLFEKEGLNDLLK